MATQNVAGPQYWRERLIADLKASLIFLTRLPLARREPMAGDAQAAPGFAAGTIAGASWAFPVVGALIGAGGGLIYWLAYRLGLGIFPAATLALVATVALTGALHEDGLADTADGFGGGADRERTLAIMRDSRIGAYGTCALIASILLRWSAISAIAEPRSVFLALVCAHAAGRAALPGFMFLVPNARPDGLSATAGRPSRQVSIIAGLLGIAALAFTLGPLAALIAALLLLAANGGMAWLSMRKIGGQTGDVIGALEQINECLILLVAVAAMQGH